jgi:omega-amidase
LQQQPVLYFILKIKFHAGMKISLIQPDTVWEDKAANFARLTDLLFPLFYNTDIVILPEMFSTGFSTDPVNLAERPGGETLTWMKKMAGEGGFGLCGSYIVTDNDRYYNRFIFVSPANEVWQYDKKHLFGLGHEQDYFSAGDERVIFTYNGIRIRPLICYDLRFPVWSRNRNEYDLLIYCANWPLARLYAWTALLKARAIENQCYVAAANRIGTDGNKIVYGGESAVFNYSGDQIARAGQAAETTVTAEISSDSLIEFRSKFPFLKDADNFTIHT